MASTESSCSDSEEKSSGSEYDPSENVTTKRPRFMKAFTRTQSNASLDSNSSEDSESDVPEDGFAKQNVTTLQHANENEASIQNENDDTPGTSQGKKRLRKPAEWKRNLKKKMFVGRNKRREIANCRCKCTNKLSISEQKDIFDKYSSLTTHTEQTIYLQGCLKHIDKSRSRPRNKQNPRKRSTFKYEVKTNNGKTIPLCQKAFLSVHGIFKSRLEKKVKTRVQPMDNRGCHSSRPNRTPKEFLDLVPKFISELPARESHYTRTDSRNRKYLGPDLSITKLHENFIVKYPQNKVSYGMFSKIFNEEFNISFACPRKDICNVCTKLLVDITQAEMDSNNEALKKLRFDRELHLRRAEVVKTALSEAEKKSDDASEMRICFDFEKNLPLPVTNAQDEYYVSQLWLHVFGIHNLVTHKSTMYVYTENFALKGPNEVITCLADYLKCYKDPQQNKLKIFCDNAFSQNKNRYLFIFLDQLCKKNIFSRIEIMYPVSGHSMMPVDRDFAAIEKKRLKLVKVDNPETYIELIKSSRKKNFFDIVFVQHSLRSNGQLLAGDRIIKVGNFKDWIEPYSKPSVPGISRTRCVLLETGNPVKVSETMTGLFTGIALYKVGMNRKICGEPKLAYDESYIKIKDKKFKCVRKLIGLVTSSDIGFYERTLLNPENIVTTSRKDTGNDDDGIESDTDIYE